MPQNPTQVLVGLNGGQPTAVATTADREAIVSPVPSQQPLSIASATGNKRQREPEQIIARDV